MTMLDYKTYEVAREKFTIDQIWDIFDGDPDHRAVEVACHGSKCRI